MARHKRTLLAVEYPPSTGSGAAIILRSLFSGVQAENIVVACARPLLRDAGSETLLSCAHHALPFFPANASRLGGVLRLANLLLVPLIAISFVRLVRRYQIDVILTSPWSGEFFVAAFLASRMTGVVLYVYVLDDWRYASRTRGWAHTMFSSLYGPILRRAARVWSISKYMAEDLRHTLGVGSEVLLHVTDAPPLAYDGHSLRGRGEEATIVYAGAIYRAQLDAIQRLVEAIELIRQHRRVRLRLLTGTHRVALRDWGLLRDYVDVAQVPYDDVPKALHAADLLFLPFSFYSLQRDIVSTSLPTKLTEYLVAGVPIIVHAPDYSSIARYARESGWGVVVSRPSAAELADVIDDLVGNAALQRDVVRCAALTAETAHGRRPLIEFWRSFQVC